RGTLAAVARVFSADARMRSGFFRALATMVGAGVSVRRALSTALSVQADRAFAEAIRSIAADVERGDPLSQAFDRHPSEFGSVTRAMLRAGEERGTLDRALTDIADLEERGRALRHRVASAFAYPSIVAASAAGLVVFLVANTMPAFSAMFEQMHVPLPWGTQMLVAVGRTFGSPIFWIAVPAAALASLGAARASIRREGTLALALDRIRLRLPAVGAIVRKAATSRFARTLGLLLRSGIDAAAALELAGGVTGSLVYRRALRDLPDALRRGDTLLVALQGSGLFDGIALTLVRAGEESGTLDAMLVHLATHYDVDVESALATLGSVIEPILICIVGAIVGCIVAAILIPLYSLIGSIR
ncbi:MAG TPA: type II secretion system F family protein, partial [Verrucomicrobiae bacterium]|nr:type II secretion system F family protein [Verrucomicrobiae bacterium]